MLLLTASVVDFAHDIELIDPKKGFKELNITKPKFSDQSEPIPAEKGTYNCTHSMSVFGKSFDCRPLYTYRFLPGVKHYFPYFWSSHLPAHQLILSE